mgnify:CR=1
CAYLNEQKGKKIKSFATHLNDWQHACPLPYQKSFVKKIAAKFGIVLPLERFQSMINLSLTFSPIMITRRNSLK